MTPERYITATSEDFNKEIKKTVLKKVALATISFVTVGLLLDAIDKWGDRIPSEDN